MKIKSASMIATVLLAASQAAHGQYIALAGFTSDKGMPDLTFGKLGKVTTPLPGISVSSAALDSKQRIVVAGTLNGQIALARYTAAGALDPTFGPNHGIVVSNFRTGASGKAVAVTPTDEIVVAGQVGGQFAATRFRSDTGLIDGYCATPSHWPGEAHAITIDPGGRFAVAGQSAPDAKGNTYFLIARFTPDGCPDPSWAGSGLVSTDALTNSIYFPGLLTKSQDARRIEMDVYGGGTWPKWRRDGKELYFLSADRKLIAVDVNTPGVFEHGLPRPLFASGISTPDSRFDVSADGRRFLIPTAASIGPAPATVVVHWTRAVRP